MRMPCAALPTRAACVGSYWNKSSSSTLRATSNQHVAAMLSPIDSRWWTSFTHILLVRAPLERYLSLVSMEIGSQNQSRLLSYLPNWDGAAPLPIFGKERQWVRWQNYDNCLTRHFVVNGGFQANIGDAEANEARRTLAKFHLILDFAGLPNESNDLMLTVLGVPPAKPTSKPNPAFRVHEQWRPSATAMVATIAAAARATFAHTNRFDMAVFEDAQERIKAHWARGDVASSIAQSSPSRSPLPRAQRDETRPSARSPTRSPVSITSTLKTTTPPPPSTTDSSSDDWVQKCLTDPRVQCADGRSCPTTPAPPRSCLRSSVPFRTPLARVRCCFRCCLMHWLEESGLARCVGSRAHAIGKRVKRVNELSYTHMRARARARNIEVNSATWAGGLELGRDPLTNVMVHRRCARAVVRAPCAPYPHLTLWLPNSTAPAQIVLGGGPRLRAQGREHGPLRESIDRPTGTCLFERGFFFINVWQMCCLWWRR